MSILVAMLYDIKLQFIFSDIFIFDLIWFFWNVLFRINLNSQRTCYGPNNVH